jgi:hypothetical protein
MSNDRAARYRRLALREANSDNAKLLRLLADEAESGLLHTASVKPPGFNSSAQATPLSVASPVSTPGPVIRGH